jgi:hypothetical protein
MQVMRFCSYIFLDFQVAVMVYLGYVSTVKQLDTMLESTNSYTPESPDRVTSPYEPSSFDQKGGEHCSLDVCFSLSIASG